MEGQWAGLHFPAFVVDIDWPQTPDHNLKLLCRSRPTVSVSSNPPDPRTTSFPYLCRRRFRRGRASLKRRSKAPWDISQSLGLHQALLAVESWGEDVDDLDFIGRKVRQQQVLIGTP